LNHIAHDKEQSVPILIRKLPNRSHYPFVNLPFIRLMQSYNENSKMRYATIMNKTFISSNQKSVFVLSFLSQQIVRDSLVIRATNIQDVMS